MDAEDKIHLEKILAYGKLIDELTRGNKKPDGSFYAKHPKNMAEDSIAEIARAARTIIGRASQVIEKEKKKEAANG